MNLDNQTPFEAQHYAIADKAGNDLLLVVVKATYSFNAQGVLTVSEQPQTIEMADVYYGDPAETSIKYASDFSFGKTATDIALTGHAYSLPPEHRETYVSLKIGVLQHLVKVFGNRVWIKKFGLLAISGPQPFEKIPIVYERSFGGYDSSHKDPEKHEYESRNPVGVGFRSKIGSLPIEHSPLPNFENPENLIKSISDRPVPVGFGYIGPSWQPRAQYAGTYDKTWQENRMPLLPDDFDTRFFNAAHPALVYPGFMTGNEAVEIAGASQLGTVRFSLPGVHPQCMVEENGNDAEALQMNLDKVYFNMDEDLVVLVWSGNYAVQGKFRDINNTTCSLAE